MSSHSNPTGALGSGYAELLTATIPPAAAALLPYSIAALGDFPPMDPAAWRAAIDHLEPLATRLKTLGREIVLQLPAAADPDALELLGSYVGLHLLSAFAEGLEVHPSDAPTSPLADRLTAYAESAPVALSLVEGGSK